MLETKTLATLNTRQPADSVECFPDGKHIVCATYKLLETEENATATPETGGGNQPRVGSVTSYSLFSKEAERTDELSMDDINCTLSPISQYTCSAILDLKIYKDSSSCKVVCAGANGTVYILSCDQDYNLTQAKCIGIDKNLLCLALDIGSFSSRKVFTSLSSGELCYFDIETGEQELTKWKGHEHEAWTIACDKHSDSIIYSGGDDCRLKMWDLRINNSTPCWISKAHDMGVTNVQTSHFNENIFLSGSYDETILFWDKRNKKSPLTSISTGGGVWRLKWHRENQFRIAAACMYNGFHLFEVSQDFTNVSLISSYNNHDSIAYGIDWCYPYEKPTNDSKIDYLVTCSFYDSSLQLWSVS